MLHRFKDFVRAVVFPLYSAFSSRTGVCFFIPKSSGWWAYTRGQAFPVLAPRLFTIEYFRHFVPRKGTVVFDVGGELGYETEQFSRMVGSTGKVFVFECLPSHIKKLQRIASDRGNVEVVERACWNCETELDFFIGNTDGSSSVVPDVKGQVGQALADPSKEKLVVKTEKLDEMWKRLHPRQAVEFLKMDIEGAEYEALDGATEMLQHTRYAVIAAYHIRDGVRTADQVAQKLRQAGFSVRIDENHHVYAQRTG
ncbi:MAG: FkbM family methyltransferase [Pirellulaceae bacterium]|nr:FkbM family methyltransferase [Pirellulaceae bacterium]